MAPSKSRLPHLTAQAARFAAAGATVGLVYVGLTLLMSERLDVPLQAAIPVAYVLAVCLHFVLQREFVFRDRPSFALSTSSQASRYVVIGIVQYAATALSTVLLPEVVGVSDRNAYLAAVVCISAATFVLLRTRVFHPVENP